MTLNEIKRELYKQKPLAYFFLAKKGRLMYSADIKYFVQGLPPGPPSETKFHNVIFEIPFEDMGDAEFTYEMEAHLLIRYIIQPETSES